MYSTTSELTKKVCEEMGISFEVGFVKTMRRGTNIYVSGTIGKNNEWSLLRRKCMELGYVYKGRELN